MTDSAEPEKRGPGRPRKDASETSESKAPFKRIPFGGRRKRLYVDESLKDPGYKYYWFKDEGDNLYSARAAAWTAVSYKEAGRIPPSTGEENDPCCAHGGVGEAGRPYKMFLMRKPMELFLEDKAEVGKLADMADEAIFRKEFEDGSYGSHNVQVKHEE